MVQSFTDSKRLSFRQRQRLIEWNILERGKADFRCVDEAETRGPAMFCRVSTSSFSLKNRLLLLAWSRHRCLRHSLTLQATCFGSGQRTRSGSGQSLHLCRRPPVSGALSARPAASARRERRRAPHRRATHGGPGLSSRCSRRRRSGRSDRLLPALRGKTALPRSQAVARALVQASPRSRAAPRRLRAGGSGSDWPSGRPVPRLVRSLRRVSSAS